MTGVKSYFSEPRFYALILVLFVVLLLWRPLFAGETFFWGTPLLQFVPWLRLAASMWRAGHIPLWNPLVGCGAPLAANYQTAAFYPPNLLHMLLPAEVAIVWLTAFHLLLAGWGMYRWGRATGLSPFSSSIGALAISGSAFLVARVGLFPSVVFTFPWLPVWLWCAEELVQRRDRRTVFRMGLSLGLGLLAGHAQTAFYGLILLSAYLIFRIVQTRGSALSWKTTTMAYAIAMALGVGLAAIQLLPTAELMLLSQRSGGVRYDFAMTYSFWPWRILTLFAPDLFGNPGRGDYWGYASYWEDAGYIGLLPLLLALWAVAGRRARRKACIFWAAVALVALAFALGRNTPLFPLLFRYLPTFDWFQAPARWLAVVTVALAALSALGAEQWPAGIPGRRYGAWGIVTGLAAILGGTAARWMVAGMPDTFGPAVIRLGATLVVAGALVLLICERLWWKGAILGFIVLDLLLAGWPLIPTIGRSLYRTTSGMAAALSREPGPVRIYWPADLRNPSSDRDAEYRVRFGYLAFNSFGPRDLAYWSQMHQILLPNTAMLDGLASANNFDSLLPAWYWDMAARAVEYPSLLRVMGVTHVISDRPWPGGEEVVAQRTAVSRVGVFRLPDSPGRAWVVPKARHVARDEMLALLTAPDFDPATEVLLEQRGDASQGISATSGTGYALLSLQDAPNRVTIHITLETPGYLVLADTWYPGWEATVDGRPAPLMRANYAFRAVWLERGEHTVEMAYRPASLVAGGIISVTALLALSWLGLAPVRAAGKLA